MPSLIDIYDRWILSTPKRTLILLALFLGAAIYPMQFFKLDASPDSLILENDKDLLYTRKIQERYTTKDFLFITFTPKNEDLFSKESLNTLTSLRKNLQNLERIDNVVTLLDAPLLQNPPAPLKDLIKNIKTLEHPEVDISLAKKEFRESPLYQDLLISKDLKSSAIQVNFAWNEAMANIMTKRTVLLTKQRENLLSANEAEELTQVVLDYEQLKETKKKQRHEDINTIRQIIEDHRDQAQLFLGGVPMVIDDMISFVKNDLRVFGTGMLLFLMATLGIIFRRLRWIFLPLVCCIASSLIMVGLLGLFGWEVTVVSSNFISLQLILTMSFAIHFVVRHRELLREKPEAPYHELIKDTVRTIFVPCLYSALTTIAGFTSLVICDILPIVNFGWMMTAGLIVSLTFTFLFFPTALSLMSKLPPYQEPGFGPKITSFFARQTERHGHFIISMATVITVFIGIGLTKIEVENSFINYFKEDTEIYQGMTFIDKNLGGTTPLDITVDFPKPEEKQPLNTEENDDDDFFDEFSEFEETVEGDDAKYWFTADKMETIEKVHDTLDAIAATGKVMSIATVVKLAKQIIGDRPLDTFDLALLLNEMPDTFRKIIIDPFVSIENDQLRIMLRINDSLPGLRRNQLLTQIDQTLNDDLGLNGEARLTGIMVLYNNMLQSLFRSQIETIGFTVAILMVMFMILFRSIKISLIALFPNFLASLVILGYMGWAGLPLDMMTITIVAISVGIAVDNTIHYLFRFKREFARLKNYTKTMHACHGSIGNAMFYTSLTIVAGFSILAFSNFIPTMLFGLLTALAMIMALLAALSLLPRLIVLFKPFGPQ